MSWRDRFKEGSFRGAPFLIQESQLAFGRRNQSHEYPQRDTPWAEDLGRKARAWTVECLVVGEDYDLARDALIRACEAKGPGTLVHPYLGTLRAVCGQATVTDSTANGGMATFSLPFVEAGSNAEPAATPDTGAAANAAAANVQTSASADAVANLKVPATESFVGGAAVSLLGGASAAIGGALAAVRPLATAAFAVEQQIGALVTNAASLLAAPAQLAGLVFGAVGQVGELATYADDAYGALTGLMGFGGDLPAVPLTTPSRLVQATNQAVLVRLVQSAAAAAVVNVVAETDFASYDEAAATRDQLGAQLDDLATSIADAGADDLAASIDALRLAMVRDVTARGASLASLRAFTPATTLPAVVIAQSLYGDATQADDLIARNVIENPLFVPGGLALEVLDLG